MDGSFYEVEEAVLQAYKVPAEEVERQMQHLKISLRLDLEKEFRAQSGGGAASRRPKRPRRRT